MVGKEQTMFRLRVLPFFDSIHGFYVAQCLETGSITTASDRETALDMMDELLDPTAEIMLRCADELLYEMKKERKTKARQLEKIAH